MLDVQSNRVSVRNKYYILRSLIWTVTRKYKHIVQVMGTTKFEFRQQMFGVQQNLMNWKNQK